MKQKNKNKMTMFKIIGLKKLQNDGFKMSAEGSNDQQHNKHTIKKLPLYHP